MRLKKKYIYDTMAISLLVISSIFATQMVSRQKKRTKHLQKNDEFILNDEEGHAPLETGGRLITKKILKGEELQNQKQIEAQKQAEEPKTMWQKLKTKLTWVGALTVVGALAASLVFPPAVVSIASFVALGVGVFVAVSDEIIGPMSQKKSMITNTIAAGGMLATGLGSILASGLAGGALKGALGLLFGGFAGALGLGAATYYGLTKIGAPPKTAGMISLAITIITFYLYKKYVVIPYVKRKKKEQERKKRQKDQEASYTHRIAKFWQKPLLQKRKKAA